MVFPSKRSFSGSLWFYTSADLNTFVMEASSELKVFSPAKINLMLAITALRDDGFHDLISLVAPLSFGDWIRMSWCDTSGEDTLQSASDQIPLGANNLVLQAAQLFKAKTNCAGRFSFYIDKCIPVGAGLGGGSSNAAVTLMGMNRLLGEPIDASGLRSMAAKLGSDCPLFLEDKSVIMRGRGERIERLPPQAQACISGTSVLLLKPEFSIATAWAYGQTKAGGGKHYAHAATVEKQLSSWLDNASLASLPRFNTMESVCFKKYIALPVMIDKLLSEFGIQAMMSGSGSACFALLSEDAPYDAIREMIVEGWGEGAFIQRAEIR